MKKYVQLHALCCADCNMAKMERTFEDFKSWIEKVYHHQFPERK
jgi:hypothetical protein